MINDATKWCVTFNEYQVYGLATFDGSSIVLPAIY